MISHDIIRKIKQATVAIGVAEKGSLKLLSIHGSGFIVDKNGIILTAKHVFEACSIFREHYLHRKINTEIAIFRPIYESNTLDFDRGVIHEIKSVNYTGNEKNFRMISIDLAFGKMKKPFPDFNPLSIKEPQTLKILDEVAVCGYPAGEDSLDIRGKRIGLRFSSIFQMGRIAGLLPFDDAPNPYGIQTDIIGVGGSSGSPLVDPNDGSVIGIAQKVLPAGIEVDISDNVEEKKIKYGTATIGQIYGLTNHILRPASDAVRQYYSGQIIKNFTVNATGLDFNYSIQEGE